MFGLTLLLVRVAGLIAARHSHLLRFSHFLFDALDLRKVTVLFAGAHQTRSAMTTNFKGPPDMALLQRPVNTDPLHRPRAEMCKLGFTVSTVPFEKLHCPFMFFRLRTRWEGA
jgi:hypothetical protein